MTATINERVPISEIVSHVCNNLLRNESELTKLDRAIGDGDHGLNVRNGCHSLLNVSGELDLLETDAAIIVISDKLFDSMGGAAGALYGSFFQALGKNCMSDFSQFKEGFTSGVDSVKRRGKVQAGDKTLLDVLDKIEPALLKKEISLSSITSLAKHAVSATVKMKAKRGRAAMLGDRSIGHMDPGALSCAIIIESICELLESRT